ncbi:hypothetical protein [Methylocystis sp.]|uniref:hypothetical protein n=1 Tax=Methylocystis sp. TaxID=1911079 RepID=UPI003DA5C2B8
MSSRKLSTTLPATLEQSERCETPADLPAFIGIGSFPLLSGKRWRFLCPAYPLLTGHGWRRRNHHLEWRGYDEWRRGQRLLAARTGCRFQQAGLAAASWRAVVPVIVFEKKRGLVRQEFSEARVIRMLADSSADAVTAIGDDAATVDLP